MNLTKLFETQKKLDQRIIKQHGLEGQDLLPQKILALQVELGECANEWRGFKFWSKDQEPRVTSKCVHCDGNGQYPMFVRTCSLCGGNGLSGTNPLLEEYVDSLHFILSIGLSSGYTPVACDISVTMSNVLTQFRRLSQDVVSFDFHRNVFSYHDLLKSFKGLGELLGFTWEQIEQAYYDKNKINHTRQATGY